MVVEYKLSTFAEVVDKLDLRSVCRAWLEDWTHDSCARRASISSSCFRSVVTVDTLVDMVRFVGVYFRKL